MSSKDEDDERIYKVVVNHEEQYSVWLADRAQSSGWKEAGKTGSRADCLAWIKGVWTDLRPLSLRRKMGEG